MSLRLRIVCEMLTNRLRTAHVAVDGPRVWNSLPHFATNCSTAQLVL